MYIVENIKKYVGAEQTGRKQGPSSFSSALQRVQMNNKLSDNGHILFLSQN